MLTQENQITPRKTCPSATLCNKNRTPTVLDVNPGFHDEKPMSKSLLVSMKDNACIDDIIKRC